MDGSIIDMDQSPDSMPCGIYEESPDGVRFSIRGMIDEAKAAH
jgi:hypothetical protein